MILSVTIDGRGGLDGGNLDAEGNAKDVIGKLKKCGNSCPAGFFGASLAR